MVTKHVIEFINESKDRPFFCYVPFHIAHAPLQAKPDDLTKVDSKLAASLPSAKAETSAEEKHHHAAMLHALDNNVAAILAELDQRGIRANTIFVLTSDNGAMEAGSSLPLRGAKHSVYEGGVRFPTVIHWPKGGLTGGTTWRDEDSLRTADWKMHRFFDRFELYAMKSDASEVTNVADMHPEVVKSLVAKMDTWAESLGAALTHRPAPAKFNAKPVPEGEVLEVTVTVTDKAKPSDRLIIPFATCLGRQADGNGLDRVRHRFFIQHSKASSFLLTHARQ